MNNLDNLKSMLTAKSDLSCADILSWCTDPDEYAKVAEIALDLIQETDDILFQARLYKLLSNLAKKELYPNTQMSASTTEYEKWAFERVCAAVRAGLRLTNRPTDLKIAIRSDEVVWVSAPARIELAGGWSDTPPYCLERGGNVLNAAVTLNGQYPIQVIGKIHPEPVIRLSSIDLASTDTITDISQVMSFSDPNDWFSLPKSALVAIGIISNDAEGDLCHILKKFGGGIDLTLFSAVPSGSGLGVSSILGSALIVCLSKMFGIEITQNELFNKTLYMEQLMTTGGGWQDQIGGTVGGTKLIRTKPGLFQSPQILWTDMTHSVTNISDRFLMYYTGYRRMAKDIVQRIMGRYLDRDPATLELIGQNQKLAIEAKEALDGRDISAFGEKIAEVWELHKKLDPEISNEKIEEILGKVSDYICGARLLGAGSGGFLFMVTKGEKEAREITKILTREPPNSRARFFDFDIDHHGLKVSVL